MPRMTRRAVSLFVVALCSCVTAAMAATSATTAPSPLEKADAAIKTATTKASTDPLRPIYHFHAPAQWMNDPNGPIEYEGWYHIFYQTNPYDDQWNHMHWGHARSRDMLHWEYLPVALAPSTERGEDHCFSGCCTLNGDGKPMIFYTSIGAKRDPEQWAAIAQDDDLRTWKKLDKPVLTQADNAPEKVREWRDPCVFRDGDKTYLVTGGMLDAKTGCVQLYEATSPDLSQWKRRGVLHQEAGDIECPLFFKLQDKWVLVISTQGHAKYHTGRFDADTGKFTSEKSAWLDESDQFYAPNTLQDVDGRRIVFGWVRGWKPGRGWNGCFSLPRELTLAADGTLRQLPIGQTSTLFGDETGEEAFKITMGTKKLPNAKGNAACLFLKFDPAQARGALGFNVRCSPDGKRKVPVSYDSGALNVAGTRYALALEGEEQAITLVVFLDRSLLEVYAQSGRVCITKVLKDVEPTDVEAELFLDKGEIEIEKLKTWAVKSAYDK